MTSRARLRKLRAEAAGTRKVRKPAETVYFGDARTQEIQLREQIRGINAQRTIAWHKNNAKRRKPLPGDAPAAILIDEEKAVQRLYKRIARFYGLDKLPNRPWNRRSAA